MPRLGPRLAEPSLKTARRALCRWGPKFEDLTYKSKNKVYVSEQVRVTLPLPHLDERRRLLPRARSD